MNDANQPNDQPPKKVKKSHGLLYLLLLVLLILIVAVAAGAGFGYLQLMQTNRHLASRVTALQQRADQTATSITAVQASMTNVQAATQKSQALADQQQQLLNSWRVGGQQVTTIYTQLTQLDQLMDSLPFPATPLPTHQTMQAIAVNPNLNWWQKGLAFSWHALSKVVIVRHNQTGALPLVLPEEKAYLHLNLHMEMQSAIWGLLQQNNTIYQDSLLRAKQWIMLYFMPNAKETKAALTAIDQLQKNDVTSAAAK